MATKTMWRVTGRIQRYSWGALHDIPGLAGVAADGRPAAEVWYGAHPAAPALASPSDPWTEADDTGRAVASAPLNDVIGSAPQAVLGEVTLLRFGPQLPYLVKFLAAARPLSLQAHPTRDQAREGFARERRAAVAGSERNYADEHHKPETLTALTSMRALAGFREPGQIASDLARLAVPELDEIRSALEAGSDQAASDRIAVAFPALLRLSPAGVAAALSAVREHSQEYGNGSPSDPLPSSEPVPQSEEGAAAGWGSDSLAVAREILDFYPEDVGALASVFLNPVLLAPGQALSVSAGVVHCYVQGLGFEVMASSDNVLRAGLTSKRVDVDELSRILDFTPSPPRVDDPRATSSSDASRLTRWSYPARADEYAVAVYDLSALAAVEIAEQAGPRLVLGLDGAVIAASRSGRVALAPGDAVLASADERLSLSGRGRVVVVSVPGLVH